MVFGFFEGLDGLLKVALLVESQAGLSHKLHGLVVHLRLIDFLDDLDLDRNGVTDFFTLVVGDTSEENKLLMEDVCGLEDLNRHLDSECSHWCSLGKRNLDRSEDGLKSFIKLDLQVEGLVILMHATVAEDQLNHPLVTRAGNVDLLAWV